MHAGLVATVDEGGHPPSRGVENANGCVARLGEEELEDSPQPVIARAATAESAMEEIRFMTETVYQFRLRMQLHDHQKSLTEYGKNLSRPAISG